ncbi:GPI mannosyltransferase 4-like, partial [Centruroides sculpturatus]|uniref:GPI mannosyltransferase 4-like n=1 Tax=Centruroides sculpturatus TaxID=218467 RepID=UPI000C6EFCFB
MRIYYWKLAVALRFLLTVLPQNGYIHPDEFFQTSEVVAGDVFNFEVLRSWEFEENFPIRCIVFPYLTAGIPFLLMNKLLSPILSFNENPLLLLLIPRLVMFCLMLGQDWCLYKICKMFKKNYVYSLFIFSTSYVTIVFYTRTFSNSIESLLFSFLLLVVSKVIYELSESNNDSNDIPYGNLIGLLLALGIYNRPTFILFAFVPVLFWLQIGLKKNVLSFIVMFCRLLTVIPTFVIVCFLLTLIDTIYYSKTSISHLFNHLKDIFYLFQNLIFTPINFIHYNLDNSNLAIHGIHPRFLHLLINVPLLFGILGLMGIFCYIQILLKMVKGLWPFYDLLPHNSMMLMSFVFPILTLSLFCHQEPRFLIPVLLPLCFLFSDSIYGYTLKKQWLFMMWILSNLVCGFFFGFVHQGGLIPSMISLQKVLMKNNKLGINSHVIFYHTYMPPRYLLNLNSTDPSFIHDLSGNDYIIFENTVNDILSKDHFNETVKLYVVIPNTISEQTLNSKFVLLTKFYPHFSSEDPPNFKEFYSEQWTFDVFKRFFG